MLILLSLGSRFIFMQMGNVQIMSNEISELYIPMALILLKKAYSKDGQNGHVYDFMPYSCRYREIGKKAWLFAKLQPGRARKRINAT